MAKQKKNQKNPDLSLTDTRAPKGMDKDQIKNKTVALLQELDELQNLLYAQAKHSILIVIQGMDASGKDGLISDVFRSMNPQGVRVTSFKVPTKEESAHDFLWRIHKNVPEKGMIQVFNRSHYEDVLVTRVHGLCDDETALRRMKAINDFEQLLSRHNDTIVIKLYLNVSHKEQLERLQERIHIPRKMWKYNENDFVESKLWNKYMKYYKDVFATCNDIPWHIIPSDQNWYKSYLVASLLHDTLKNLKMEYPGLKKEA